MLKVASDLLFSDKSVLDPLLEESGAGGTSHLVQCATISGAGCHV